MVTRYNYSRLYDEVHDDYMDKSYYLEEEYRQGLLTGEEYDEEKEKLSVWEYTEQKRLKVLMLAQDPTYGEQ